MPGREARQAWIRRGRSGRIQHEEKVSHMKITVKKVESVKVTAISFCQGD